MAVKVTTLITGVDRLSRELKLTVPHIRARVQAAIKRSVEKIAAEARARAPKRSGELVSTIRAEYGNDGLAGYVKVGFGKLPRRSQAQTAKGRLKLAMRKRKTGRGAYGPVIEHGDPRRHRPAQPFLRPGFTAQRPVAVREIDSALRSTVEEIGS